MTETHVVLISNQRYIRGHVVVKVGVIYLPVLGFLDNVSAILSVTDQVGACLFLFSDCWARWECKLPLDSTVEKL